MTYSGSSAAADRDGDWLDVGPTTRRALTVGTVQVLGILVLGLVLLGGCAVGLRNPALPPDSAVRPLLWVGTLVGGLVLLGALVALGATAAMLPSMLSRGGAAVDDSGVTLQQDPRWWFRGRRLHVPWPRLDSAEPVGSGSEAGRTPRRPTLVLHLNGASLREKAPHWAVSVPPGAQPPTGESKNRHPRVFVTFSGRDTERFLHLIAQHQPGPGPEGTGDRRPDLPNPRDRAAAWSPEGAENAPMADRVDLQGTRTTHWVVYCCLAVGAPLLFMALYPLEAAPGGDGAPLVIAVALALLALCSLGVLVLLGPRFWARQAVEVTADHLRIVQAPMWWYRGSAVETPWQDVRQVIVGRHPRSAAGNPVLEVLLHRAGPMPRLPRWAVFTPADRALWGRTTPYPRLVFALGDAEVHERVTMLLRRARGDLFQATAPAGASDDAEADSVGASDVICATDDDAGTGDHWINVRGRGIYPWVMGSFVPALATVAFLVGLVMGLVEKVNDPGAPMSADLREMISLSAGFVPVAGVLVFVMPQLFTRQGVAVGRHGLSLVQRRLLWLRERTAVIAWHEIRQIHPSRALTPESLFTYRQDTTAVDAVDVLLNDPHADLKVPTWAHMRHQHLNFVLPGAVQAPRIRTVEAPRIRINISHKRHPELLRAIAAERPDLLDTTETQAGGSQWISVRTSRTPGRWSRRTGS